MGKVGPPWDGLQPSKAQWKVRPCVYAIHKIIDDSFCIYGCFQICVQLNAFSTVLVSTFVFHRKKERKKRTEEKCLEQHKFWF